MHSYLHDRKFSLKPLFVLSTFLCPLPRCTQKSFPSPLNLFSHFLPHPCPLNLHYFFTPTQHLFSTSPKALLYIPTFSLLPVLYTYSWHRLIHLVFRSSPQILQTSSLSHYLRPCFILNGKTPPGTAHIAKPVTTITIHICLHHNLFSSRTRTGKTSTRIPLQSVNLVTFLTHPISNSHPLPLFITTV